MNNINTPYDNAYRTLQNDCPELIIPIVNELFNENYTGREKIVFSQNELFFQQIDGKEAERVTDSSFYIIRTIKGKIRKKRYHLECQSTPDGSMIIRMFEYDALIAVKNGKKTKSGLVVRFPQSAVLYLRHTKNTPDKLTIRMETPGGNLTYTVPILKVKKYSIEEIFEKKLLFLIPFYIFCYETKLKELSENSNKLQALEAEYRTIRKCLDELCEQGHLDEYTKRTIIRMTENVVNSLAANYEKIAKGVVDSMFGKILDYEEKDILNRGKNIGRQEGNAVRLIQSIDHVMKNLSVDLNEACHILGITLTEYEQAKALK